MQRVKLYCFLSSTNLFRNKTVSCLKPLNMKKYMKGLYAVADFAKRHTTTRQVSGIFQKIYIRYGDCQTTKNNFIQFQTADCEESCDNLTINLDGKQFFLWESDCFHLLIPSQTSFLFIKKPRLFPIYSLLALLSFPKYKDWRMVPKL